MNKKMDDRYVDAMLQMGKDFFGQFNDLTEIEATRENYEKIAALHPSTYKYKVDENGKLFAWTVVFPTQKKLAMDFIAGRITERELLALTEKRNSYDALYLFAAFTLPEYRRRGYAKEMLKEQVREIVGDKKGSILLFAWAVTKEGKKMIEALSRDLGVDIALRVRMESIDK